METRRAASLAMPGEDGGDAPLSLKQARSNRIFKSRAGFATLGTAEFEAFRRVASELLGGYASEAEAERLANELSKIEAFRRLWEEYQRSGANDPRAFAAKLRASEAFAKLLAALAVDPLGRALLAKLVGRSDDRVLVDGDRRPSGETAETPERERPRLSSGFGGSSAEAKAFTHVFAFLPPAERERISAQMENGYGVWDACRRTRLFDECRVAVLDCSVDAGCGPWLRTGMGGDPDIQAALATPASVRDQVHKRRPPPTQTASAGPSAAPQAPPPAPPTSESSSQGGGGDDEDPPPPPPPAQEERWCRPWPCCKNDTCGDTTTPDADPDYTGTATETRTDVSAPPPPPPPDEDEDGPRPGCFAAGTRIRVPGGDVAIERLGPGDAVYSYDEEVGLLVERKIAAVHRVPGRDVRVVRLHDGRALKVTAEHPFYVPALRGYAPVKALRSGTILSVGGSSPGREPVAVESIEPGEDGVPVFNLSVDVEPRNYFAEGVLVHNKMR